MKAQDLQIGDWVLDKMENVPVRVTAIEGDGVRQLYGKMYDGDFAAIKLTPKILEKNGFVHGEDNELKEDYHLAMNLKQIPQTVVEYTFYKNPIMGCDSLLRCWTKAPDCDGQNDAHLCNIEYVHELQHCFKLVGISLDIKL